MMIVKPTLRSAYDLFHEGLLCFTDMEDEGICIDRAYYEKTYIHLTKRVKFLSEKINDMPEAKTFQKKVGKSIMSFDIDKNKLHVSSLDLSKLFFTYLGMTPIKSTEKGRISSDDDVLEKIGTPFAKEILKVKKLEKNRTTYVLGVYGVSYLDELDGIWKIHPSFNLHIPKSYRSSSNDPNFQNMPVHDPESMALVRSGIIPRPGNKLGWADYGGHELRVFACYCKDPQLIRDILNKVDIHDYWGEFLGVSRYDAKNGFVFALIYGSYYGSIFNDLRSRGYKFIKESTVQKAEKEFWKKYSKAKEWQEEWVRSYYNRGYLEMLTGFRVQGWLSKNQIVNIPVQGTAFHLLLWSCVQVNNARKKEGWKTKLTGQIHDEMDLDINPGEESHVRSVIEKTMVEDTRRAFPWVNVPLLSEYGSCEVNASWGTAKK
jgi:DNA polymerase-1